MGESTDIKLALVTDPQEPFLAKMIEWLKAKREEYRTDSTAWHVVDGLLDDAREAYHTGVMPWELSNDD